MSTVLSFTHAAVDRIDVGKGIVEGDGCSLTTKLGPRL